MTRFLSILVLVLATALSAACGWIEELDQHGDQHLWYSVYKSNNSAMIKWTARMSPSKDATCAASDMLIDLRAMDKCNMARISGSAKDVADAVAIIHRHFDDFVTHNGLMNHRQCEDHQLKTRQSDADSPGVGSERGVSPR